MLQRTTCAPGTRVHLLDSIIAWARNPSLDSENMFWLFGPAGSGKSTIAHTIARHFDGPSVALLGGNFFCSRQFPETREPRYIIRTLVYHLSRRCSLFAAALNRSPDFDTTYQSVAAQIQDLLVTPWQASTEARVADPSIPSHYLMVIDALDEIDGNGGSEFLRDLFDVLNRNHLPGLRFFATSRMDPNLIDRVNSLNQKRLFRLQDIGNEEARDDIKRFLMTELPFFAAREEMASLVAFADGCCSQPLFPAYVIGSVVTITFVTTVT